ncbi:DUF740 family protein [Senna tora]|uniref:DUF740 family protein n=1 Tax=Senna tora TaxID=362788 RepID=A0A834SUS0_9FABA|nr:DUF740 family protein [Senna tora]
MVICSLFNRDIISGRVCNLIESEFALRRSRSMEISFLRSRSRFFGGDRDFDPDITEESMAPNRSKSTSSMFKPWVLHFLPSQNFIVCQAGHLVCLLP